MPKRNILKLLSLSHSVICRNLRKRFKTSSRNLSSSIFTTPSSTARLTVASISDEQGKEQINHTGLVSVQHDSCSRNTYCPSLWQILIKGLVGPKTLYLWSKKKLGCIDFKVQYAPFPSFLPFHFFPRRHQVLCLHLVANNSIWLYFL